MMSLRLLNKQTNIYILSNKMLLSNTNYANVIHIAFVVQWIGHNFAEVVMLVRFQPRAHDGKYRVVLGIFYFTLVA